MKESKKKESIDLYIPDGEEVMDAVVFLSNCSSQDLRDGWIKISTEWDIDSISQIHRSLCKSGRINILLKQFACAGVRIPS